MSKLSAPPKWQFGCLASESQQVKSLRINMANSCYHYSNNNLAESNIKAVEDNSSFMQLVNDCVWELKHGRSYYCFSQEQISAIRSLLPLTYELEIITQDGYYCLYAHRGN